MVDFLGLLAEKRTIYHRMIYEYYPEVVTSPGNEILLLVFLFKIKKQYFV